MTLLRSLAMAFLTFSRVPMPHVDWTPQSMRYMMCFFPFVGTLAGLLVGLWCWLSGLLGFGPLMAGLGATVVPLLVTGGIHMDGFCDTVDAQASHADPARKREILKDPNSGAFAVTAAAVYVLCYFVFASELPYAALGLAGTFLFFSCQHTLSRCLSSIATVSFPLAGSDGMLAAEHGSSERRPSLVFCTVLAALVVAALVSAWRIVGAVTAVVALLGLVGVRVFSQRQFGGMSGDLAGFFLQATELAMLVCFCVLSKVVF